MEDQEEEAVLLEKLCTIVREIAGIKEFKCVIKKQCRDLLRRLMLLMPLFEELEEVADTIPPQAFKALAFLLDAFVKAKVFLSFGSRGSIIYMVLERDRVRKQFQELAVCFTEALSGISYDKLDIAAELKEQTKLVQAQFKRAQKQFDAVDSELFKELSCIYNRSDGIDGNSAVLHRLCRKLKLLAVKDIEKEYLAMQELIVAPGNSQGENAEKMFVLLKKFEDLLMAQNVNYGISSSRVCSLPSNKGQAEADQSSQSPVIPDDFRCPISLDLMNDPVIIATGQTYERACIKKWLDAGHGTCPKTQQILSTTNLIPNHVLSSIISNWCQANGMDAPKRFGNLHLSKAPTACFAESLGLDALLTKLTSGDIQDQRFAAGELRSLARHNNDNRVCIAECGAIPLLADLLYADDSCTQEHSVTALLNLSICEDNKGIILSSGAVSGILHLLKNGSVEARENAAATIFSLSALAGCRETIGESEAIPLLIRLLKEGTQRGKIDAAAALFSLCKYQQNRGRAVEAGAVPVLVTHLTHPGSEMVDQALTVLAVLASHPEAKAAISLLNALPTLVQLVTNACPRSRENAAAVLAHICTEKPQLLSEAIICGVMDPLRELAENGSTRGKQKAAKLLKLIGSRNKYNC